MAQSPTSLYCSVCTTGTLRRLHRNWAMRTFFSWLPHRLYECKRCGRKFWRRPIK